MPGAFWQCTAGTQRGFPNLRIWHRQNTFESLFLGILVPFLLCLLMGDQRDSCFLFCFLHLTADPSARSVRADLPSLSFYFRPWGLWQPHKPWSLLQSRQVSANSCLRSVNVFSFHRSSQNSQKMVTTVQLEQQVREAAILLSFEFRSRCYNLSCKWNCRNDLLLHLHNSLALYLGAQVRTGCLHSREKALSSLSTYQLVLGEMIMGL